jgi:hypothetical protein
MDLFKSALSLVIHKNGCVDAADVDDLLNFYREKKGISIDHKAYWRTVDSARHHYSKEQNKLFVCTDKPCLKNSFVNPSGRSLDALAGDLGCDVEATGCQWKCEDAPVLTLKIASEQYTFSRCSTVYLWSGAQSSICAILQEFRAASNSTIRGADSLSDSLSAGAARIESTA